MYHHCFLQLLQRKNKCEAIANDFSYKNTYYYNYNNNIVNSLKWSSIIVSRMHVGEHSVFKRACAMNFQLSSGKWFVISRY